MADTYLVFVIQGYEHENPDGLLVNLSTCELIDTDAKKAIERAKKILKVENKKFFRISAVIEKHIGT